MLLSILEVGTLPATGHPESAMVNEPNEYVRKAIRLAAVMKNLADEGEVQAPDSGCAVLFGVIRDCAYKIQGRAEQEEDEHRGIRMLRKDGESAPDDSSLGRRGR
jgi:predicted hydrolase (HD superfamily)